MKRRRLVVDETEERMGRFFSVYGTPLTAVSLFRYLVRMLSSSDNDCPGVERNLWRARRKWVQMTNILGRGGGGRIRERRGGYMWQWFKRCLCLGPRRGF